MSTKMQALSLFDGAIIGRAAGDAVRKLDPRKLARNPVIFVTEVVSLVVTILFLRDLITRSDVAFFTGQIAAWLWFNTTLGIAMLLGRFAYVIPVLALAGSLAAKKKIPASAGTFPTDGPLFVGLLVGVIVILYLLQYFPALSLAPIVEHFLMLGGKTF